MSAAEPLKSSSTFDFWTTQRSCISARTGSSLTCQGDHPAPACCSNPTGIGANQIGQTYLCGAWRPGTNGTSEVYNATSVPAGMQTKYACNNLNATDMMAVSEPLLPSCCTANEPQTAMQSFDAYRPPPPPARSSSKATGAIVGGVVGGVAALAIIGAIAGSWCFYRRRWLRSQANVKNRRPLQAVTNPWATSSYQIEGTSFKSGAHSSRPSSDTHTWSDHMFRSPTSSKHGVMQLAGASPPNS